MKFVFVSKSGESIPIAMRVAWEGHSVTVMIDDPEYRDSEIGKGVVALGTRPTLETIMAERPDCVVFDMVGLGHLAADLREMGVPVFGGSAWADAVELNRDYGESLMVASGINVPQSELFEPFAEDSAWDRAREFVQKSGKRYVYKPSGNMDASQTYVAKGVEDMIEMLHVFEKHSYPDTFILQEFIDGVEVSCEGWFNGIKFLRPFNITFEEKKFLEGDLGPNTGCMGNVVKPLSSVPRLVREGIGRIEKILKASDYRGPIDLNTIVTEDTLYGLEFTARFGYDAIYALAEGIRDPLGEVLHGVATGTIDLLRMMHEWFIAVRLSVPPYPHEHRSEFASSVRVPVIGLNDEILKHFWPTGIAADGNRTWTVAPDGLVASVSAWGTSVKEAQRRAYRTIDNLTIPNVQYRRDIGDRAMRDYNRLLGWDWI